MMTDFFDFLEWVKTGELAGLFVWVMLAALMGISMFLPRNGGVRYSSFRGRQDVEITYIAERPTEQNRFNRNGALGELQDGQEVWVGLDSYLMRQQKTVTASILCTETQPVMCIGIHPVPVFQAVR